MVLLTAWQKKGPKFDPQRTPPKKKNPNKRQTNKERSRPHLPSMPTACLRPGWKPAKAFSLGEVHPSGRAHPSMLSLCD